MTSLYEASDEEMFDLFYEDLVFEIFETITDNCWRDCILQKLRYADFRELLLDNVYIPSSLFGDHHDESNNDSVVF